MTVLYSLLGPVSVQVDDRELDLGPKKQRSLLALLLIHRNRTVATDRILEALWGEDAVGKENALWVYISRLRSILSEVSSDEILVTRDRGYTIQVEPQSVDVDRFSELTSLGMSQLDSDPHEAADSLAQALAMWKGSPVEDFTYDEFAQTEINRLNTLRRNCLDARIDADLQIGRSGEVVSEIEQQVESRPYDETPVRQLVLALYRSGRQTEALRAFERFRRLIGENAGTEPSPELCRLEEQVLFHDPALGRRSTAASHANPYRGLEAFREEDASVFFGRDRLSAHLLTSLDEGPIVTLVGPSGSGKSSVMRSGVIPALRKGSLPGSDQWNIATMLPGSHPFVELEAALLRTRLDAPESLRGQLDGQSDEILRAALRIGVTEESVVVIMIDQFEELFTNCEPALAQRFLTAVVAATKDPRHRVRFLLTLRSDFYDRPLRHREFGIVMADGIVNIVPMAPEELEAAAAGPARNVGVRLEPALEAALIGDVLGEPGALPLFQFALADLFDRRVGETLTLDAYRGMGGIEGAVSRKAEYLFDGLNQRQREATRQLFLRLVTITEGTSNSRRRVEASELLSLDLDAEDLQTVLVAFGEERLLSFDRSEITGSPTVEVAHEALLSRWDRLSEWIRNAQDDVKRNARLTTLADEWEDSSRDSAYLLAEGRYVQYADWAAESTMKLARPEIEFLAASATAHEERVEAETERAVRERASARRAKRNAWGLAAVISAVVLVSVSILWFASRPAGPTVAWVYPASEVGGVIHTSTRTGFEASERELGIEFLDVPIVQNPEETIRDVFDSGAELVVVSNDTSEIVLNVADDYPDARVLVIDTYWEYGPGVFTVVIDDAENAYLMGIAAALTSQTGRIGFIGGWQDSFIEIWAASFEDGALATDPTTNVHMAWVNEQGAQAWNDPDSAFEAAMSLFDEGVDVVFTAAGGGGAGSILAARQHTEATGRQTWAIGVDADEGYLSSQGLAPYVLTSAIKRFDVVVEDSLRQWLNGSLKPKTWFGLANGGLGYSFENSALDPAIAAMEEARQLIVAGVIEPSITTATPSTWRSSHDAIMGVEATKSACVAEPSDLSKGDIITLALHNLRAESIAIGLAHVPASTDRDAMQAIADRDGHIFGALGSVGAFTPNQWTVPAGANYELRSTAGGHGHDAILVVCGPFSGEPVFSEVMQVLP